MEADINIQIFDTWREQVTDGFYRRNFKAIPKFLAKLGSKKVSLTQDATFRDHIERTEQVQDVLVKQSCENSKSIQHLEFENKELRATVKDLRGDISDLNRKIDYLIDIVSDNFKKDGNSNLEKDDFEGSQRPKKKRRCIENDMSDGMVSVCRNLKLSSNNKILHIFRLTSYTKEYDDSDLFDYYSIVHPMITEKNASFQNVVCSFLDYNAEYSWSKAKKADQNIRQKYNSLKCAVKHITDMIGDQKAVRRPPSRKGTQIVNEWRSNIKVLVDDNVEVLRKGMVEAKLLVEGKKLSVTFMKNKKKHITAFVQEMLSSTVDV